MRNKFKKNVCIIIFSTIIFFLSCNSSVETIQYEKSELTQENVIESIQANDSEEINVPSIFSDFPGKLDASKTYSIKFEQIYQKYNTDPEFENMLFAYLGNDMNRYYWIGIFLDNDYYSDINDYELSLKVLKEGLLKNEDEADKVGFYYVIGVKLFRKGLLDEAAEYLVPGYKLALYHPLSVPACFKDKEEGDIIQDFILSHIE